MTGAERRARLARSRLYLVLEARPYGAEPDARLDAALQDGIDVVQLRDKELPDGELVAAAEPVRHACETHCALFVLNGRPDRVAAVFGTPTKPDAEAGGLELVRAAAELVRTPWFAIGGVEPDTVAEVVAAGAPGVAVVRAIRDADDPAAAARALRAAVTPHAG